MAVDSRSSAPQLQLPELGAAAAGLEPHSAQGQGPGASPTSSGPLPDGWDMPGQCEATVSNGIAPAPLASPAEDLRLLHACDQCASGMPLALPQPVAPTQMNLLSGCGALYDGRVAFKAMLAS